MPWVEKGGPFLVLIFPEEFRAILRFACYRATSVVRLSTLCLDSVVPGHVPECLRFQHIEKHPQIPYFFSKISLYLAISQQSIQRILRNRQRAELVFQPAVLQICNLTAKGRWLLSTVCIMFVILDVTQASGPIPVSL